MCMTTRAIRNYIFVQKYVLLMQVLHSYIVISLLARLPYSTGANTCNIIAICNAR